MEVSSRCRKDDIVCIVNELVTRWEAVSTMETQSAEPDEPDCLPCLLSDWD